MKISKTIPDNSLPSQSLSTIPAEVGIQVKKNPYYLCSLKRRLGGFIITLILTIFFSFSTRAQTPSLADLVEGLIPSVVNISTSSEEEGAGKVFLGSGFIIDEKGFIITNAHVVDKASIITVTLSDDSFYEADLVGKDNKTDLALIKIESSQKLTPVKMGDSDKMRIGDWIIAIGNPFGLGGSVSVGIISAKERDIDSGPYDSFLQTDASINQGSSGGPMFNLNGEVVGINTALFSTTGTNMGVGFAIPSNISNWVINQLKEKGEVKRGFIGVKVQGLTPALANSLKLINQKGVVVSSLTEGGPAQRAGLKVGDIITALNKVPVDDIKNFSRSIYEMPIGRMIELEALTETGNETFEFLVEEMKEKLPPVLTVQEENTSESYISDLDIEVMRVTPDILLQYNLDADIKGLVVTNVTTGSDADVKGLKVGDVIVKVDKRDVLSIDDLKEYIMDAKMENYRPILLTIQNQNVVHFVALKLKRK